MKKIVSVILSFLIIVNTVFAYTSTVQVKGRGVRVTSNVGNIVEITPKSSDITGWTVKSGDTTVTNNKFVMPAGDVVIEGITSSGYTLTVEMPDFTRTETKEAGESVTIEATTLSTGYTFSNWTATGITLTSSQQISQTITFTMPANAVTLVANYSETPTPETYTIEYNENEGSGTIASQTKTQGVDLTLTTEKPTRAGYNFLGWSTSSSATTAEYESGGTFTLDASTILYAVWVEKTVNQDTSGANAPVIIDGLIPVNWNGSSWVETTVNEWEYNYNSVAEATQTTVAGNGNGAWANAQTADGSMYVWIPRYTYKITSGYHTSGNSWNSLDNPGTNKIEVKFSNGTTDDVTSGAANASEGYIKHPAFTFGTDELTGIWVAKYEASQGEIMATGVVDKPSEIKYVAQFKPGVSSDWGTYFSISSAYEYAYNTFRNADSHLMRNSEWGAVAYLTNAIGRIPYVNNNSNYITGIAGDTQDASQSTSTTNSWNTVKGVKASTTHNVYGIYDLSGGRGEVVSAYHKGGNNDYLIYDHSKTYGNALYTNRDTKYVEVYETNSGFTSGGDTVANIEIYTGDALYETNNSAYPTDTTALWDSDEGYDFFRSSKPFCERGGTYGAGTEAGIFTCTGSTGRLSGSFRAVLAIN